MHRIWMITVNDNDDDDDDDDEKEPNEPNHNFYIWNNFDNLLPEMI